MRDNATVNGVLSCSIKKEKHPLRAYSLAGITTANLQRSTWNDREFEDLSTIATRVRVSHSVNARGVLKDMWVIVFGCSDFCQSQNAVKMGVNVIHACYFFVIQQKQEKMNTEEGRLTSKLITKLVSPGLLDGSRDIRLQVCV